MSKPLKDVAMAPWQPDGWQQRPALQQPVYEDAAELASALAQLQALPPLVTSGEVLALKQMIAEAQEGRRFLLQGGDCAEQFADCRSELITNRLKILLQMSLVLVHGMQKPVVRVGRFAGQYAKPRSADVETRHGITLPSYRGDSVNRPEFTAAARRADPGRLLEAHVHSALTMNFTRALVSDGFADLHHPEYWDLDWMSRSPMGIEYRRMVDEIGQSLRFMETLMGQSVESASRVDFFTSHEALLLHYEQAQTRQVPRRQGWYNLSTHYPWIGMRTAALDGAHVEYFRGIRNPVAVKLGASVNACDMMRLVDALNPDNEAGRLTLITRMGAAKVEASLPPLLDAARREGRKILWVVDPMHGNTESTSSGVKTRRFDNIRAEIERSFELHRAAGTRLGGVHLELTGEDVTECLGGARDLSEHDLARAYRSSVDPRLNYEQSLELALLIARKSRET